MYAWLKSEILAMSEIDYLVLLAVLTGVFAYLMYYCYCAFRSFRFADGTATSKIRSAAQGFVELKGLGEWLSDDSIASPFSNSRCVWYHCTIEKRKKSGKRSSWSNVSDECSSALFRLVDDTGWCIIDPDHAQVIPETDITWYGHNTDYCSKPPTRARWLLRPWRSDFCPTSISTLGVCSRGSPGSAPRRLPFGPAPSSRSA